MQNAVYSLYMSMYMLLKVLKLIILNISVDGMYPRPPDV